PNSTSGSMSCSPNSGAIRKRRWMTSPTIPSWPFPVSGTAIPIRNKLPLPDGRACFAEKMRDVTVGRALDDGVPVRLDMLVEGVVDALEAERRDKVGHPPDCCRVQRDAVRVAVHERYPFRVGDDGDDVA